MSITVAMQTITAEDMKDPGLTKINQMFLDLQSAINAQAGVSGTIPIQADIDMQGHKILNQG